MKNVPYLAKKIIHLKKNIEKIDQNSVITILRIQRCSLIVQREAWSKTIQISVRRTWIFKINAYKNISEN